jgi:hypothetical protein
MKKITAIVFGCLSLIPPSGAQAYPVDCAIFLCLAGGWPASTECSHARSVFIARITPWPIEPPLQIWNCPMGVVYQPYRSRNAEIVTIAAYRSDWSQGGILTPWPAAPLLSEGGTNRELSDPVIRVIGSIRVYHLEYMQRRGSDGECNRIFRMRVGQYDEGGDFAWSSGTYTDMPGQSSFRLLRDCADYRYRGVLVACRDYFEVDGFSEVLY